MKKNIALMALTGILTLASCGQNAPTTCPTGQELADGSCVAVTGSVTYNNTQGGTYTTKNSLGEVVTATSGLPLGTYTTQLSKEGYASSQPITFTLTNTQRTYAVNFPTLVQTEVGTGSLLVSGTEAGTTVVVKNASGVETTLTGSTLANLEPGEYTISFSRDGFYSDTRNFAIVAGVTTQVTAPTLRQRPPTAATAYYLRDGAQVAIPGDAASGSFRFSAWLENRAAGDGRLAGIDPATLGQAGAGQYVSAQELTERAPSGTQNIAAAYMQYTPDGGTTWFPVVGAEVRWDILPSLLTEYTEDPNFNPNALTGNYTPYDNAAVLAEIVRRGSLIRFTAADEGSQPTGAMRPLDINDNGLSAFTITNSASGSNVPFPQAASFGTYNLTGASTPNIDGFTWTAVQDQRTATYQPNTVTLRADGTVELEGRVSQTQIRAIGYVNGMEIDKIFLEKNFVPAATPQIRKTVIGGEDGKVNGSKSFRITIYNNSIVPANDIRVSDVLKDVAQSGAYAIRGVRAQRFLSPTGSTGFVDANGNGIPDVNGVDVAPVAPTVAYDATVGPIRENAFTLTGATASALPDDGFNFGATAAGRDTVNLPAFSAITIEFDAQATAPGRYCDVATLNRYLDANLGDVRASEDGSRNRIVTNPISAEACMNIVSEPALSVTKVPGLTINGTFVPLTDPRLQPGGSLETYRRIDPGTPVTLRITVRNTGTETINDVVLTDALTSANGATHRITTLPAGATAVGDDGFTLDVGTLGQGSTRSFDFVATGDARGRYCDTATVNGVSSTNGNAITGSADACFSVDIIRFTKVNQVIRNGRLVDAATVNDISAGELVLTTVTLLNDGDTTLSNVRLYDTVANGRATNTNFLVYEDRPAIINPLVRNIVNSDGRGFDRVDAYDAKTAVLGTLAAAKFNVSPADFATVGLTPVATVGVDDSVNNGRVGQLVAGDNVLPDNDPASGIAQRAAIRLIRSDDTVVNAGDYLDFDPATEQATPGYVLLPDQQLTLRFFSRVPTTQLVQYADTYCNTAWWNYGAPAGVTGESRRYDLTEQCLTVRPLIGFRQNLDDYKFNADGTLRNDDVFTANESIRFIYSSTIEPSSTQNAVDGVITIRYGVPTGTGTTTASPAFTIDRGNTVVRIYNAGLDPRVLTAAQLADPANFRVVTAYTRTFNAGVLTIQLANTVQVQPNETVWVQNDVAAPTGTATGVEYVSQGAWVTRGSIDNREYTVPTASDNSTIVP